MPLDPILNFAKGDVSIGYDDTDVSIVLSSGDGANFPSSFPYNVVWWNSTNFAGPDKKDPQLEIVRVTARTSDTLTVTRAQEGTAATTKNTAGKTYKMILAFTKKTYDELAKNGANTDITSLGTTGTRLTKGWFTDLEVTNAIAGSVTGNAATVTTNANLTGSITSVGNATTVAASQPTITSLGTLTGLTMGGDIVMAGNDITTTTDINITTGSSATHDFKVNTTAFVVEGDTGNIGVGTIPNVAANLHLNSGGNQVIRLQKDSNFTDLEMGTNAFFFGLNGTRIFAILGNGRGSIGTEIPLAQYHVDQSSAVAAIPVLYLDQADVSEEMIEFNTTIGTGNAIEAVAAKALTTTHFIKVTIPGGLTRYIPCGTIA